MNENQIKIIQDKIEYSFCNVELLKQAFTRKSFAKENQLKTDNELLEFLGDIVMGSITTEIIIDAYAFIMEPDKQLFSILDEGKFSIRRSAIISEQYLAQRIKTLRFYEFLQASKGDEKLRIINNDSVQADLFEAIIGAIAIDSNYNYAKIRKPLIIMLDLEDVISKWFKADNLDKVAELNKICVNNKISMPAYSIKQHSDKYIAICSITLPQNILSIITPSKSREYKLTIAAKNNAAELMIAKVVKLLNNKKSNTLPKTNVLLQIKIDKKNPVNQLQELIQKGKIESMPKYTYNQNKDLTWSCECKVAKYTVVGKGISTTKKDAKKEATLSFLSQISQPSNILLKSPDLMVNSTDELKIIINILTMYYKEKGLKSNVSQFVSIVKEKIPEFKAKKYGFKNTNDFIEKQGYIIDGHLFRKSR